MYLSERMLRRRTCVIIFVLSVILVMPCRTNAVEEKKDDDPSLAYEKIEMLTEVLTKIRSDYVDDKTYQDILYGAIDGMLSSLDPYSGFLDESSYEAMKEDTAGKFGGIGIHIGKKNGLLTVIAPIEDTPAYKAGVQSGDVIEEIDGEKTYSKSLREVVDRLRGEKGEKVTIKIQRVGEEDPIVLDLIRDDITVASVKGTHMIEKGVGYLRITQFSEPTAVCLQTELDKLFKENMKALIIDLRGNPGGLLESAIQVSSKFLKKDSLIVTTKGRKKVYEKAADAQGANHYLDFPMSVLVDEGSASASEIVAGALRDNKRAIIVGSRTFGKGSVQSIRPLDSNAKTAVRMTTAYYYTPSGALIHNIGIEPDIEVNVSQREWRDVRVKRAQLENPDLYTDEEKQKYSSAVDKTLLRAVDLMEGMLILQN